jgi:hypothetical protein
MEKMYVIKNNDTDKWIGVDYNSGGYPYDTEIQRAKIFSTKESALNYRNIMKLNWSLFQLELNSIPVSWNG